MKQKHGILPVVAVLIGLVIAYAANVVVTNAQTAGANKFKETSVYGNLYVMDSTGTLAVAAASVGTDGSLWGKTGRITQNLYVMDSTGSTPAASIGTDGVLHAVTADFDTVPTATALDSTGSYQIANLLVAPAAGSSGQFWALQDPTNPAKLIIGMVGKYSTGSNILFGVHDYPGSAYPFEYRWVLQAAAETSTGSGGAFSLDNFGRGLAFVDRPISIPADSTGAMQIVRPLVVTGNHTIIGGAAVTGSQSVTGDQLVSGNQTISGTQTVSGAQYINHAIVAPPASSAERLVMLEGTAPASPSDGGMWATSAGLYHHSSGGGTVGPVIDSTGADTVARSAIAESSVYGIDSEGTTGQLWASDGSGKGGWWTWIVDLASKVTGQLPAANLTTAFASPPALGGTAPAAGTVTNLTTTGTATINNRLSIYGLQSDAANGPNIYTYTNQDAYPLYGMLNYAHGNISHAFDAYYSSGWKSSSATSNNMLTKTTNVFYMYYASGVNPGSALTWSEGWSLDNSTGKFSVKQNLDVNGGTIGSSASTVNVLNSPTTVNAFTGGTTVTAGAASSTGTFTVQETLIAGYGGKARLTSTVTNAYGALAFAFVADEAIAAGEIVMVSDSTNARVKKTGASSSMAIGVALTASGAAGDTIQVITQGVADVIYKNGVTVTRGGVAFTSSTTGQADCSATVPTTEHWQEIGHPMVSGTGDGTTKFATLLHFN